MKEEDSARRGENENENENETETETDRDRDRDREVCQGMGSALAAADRNLV